MKLTPAYSTYTSDNRQISRRWLRQSPCGGYVHLENYISRTLVGERLISLFHDVDVSGLGGRDSFMVARNWDAVVYRIGIYEGEESIRPKPLGPNIVDLRRFISRSPNSELPPPLTGHSTFPPLPPRRLSRAALPHSNHQNFHASDV